MIYILLFTSDKDNISKTVISEKNKRLNTWKNLRRLWLSKLGKLKGKQAEKMDYHKALLILEIK